MKPISAVATSQYRTQLRYVVLLLGFFVAAYASAIPVGQVTAVCALEGINADSRGHCAQTPETLALEVPASLWKGILVPTSGNTLSTALPTPDAETGFWRTSVPVARSELDPVEFARQLIADSSTALDDLLGAARGAFMRAITR